MSAIFGHLNIDDSTRVYNSTVGQRAIFDAVTEYLARVNADMQAAQAVFVGETTPDFQRQYELPGGGFLQRRGPNGRYGSVKATGHWDVGFPLEDFGAQISTNDIESAYLTIADLDRHVNTVTLQSVNTRRFEMLRALFNNVARTHTDQYGHGNLTIQPLANNDAVVYPPIMGATVEATENHYADVGYTPANISDTNNPYTTIYGELAEHFGDGANIVVFIDATAWAPTEALTDFVKVAQPNIIPGMGTDLATGTPANLPGRIIGKCKNCWIAVWAWMPTGYMLAIDLNSPRPLIERIHPADTGLPAGLQLVATNEEFPFTASFWRDMFGMGVGNRLNGVVLELGTGNGYGIPAIYA